VLVPHALQAPRHNRTVLAEPPLAQVGQLLAGNRQRLAQNTLEILGRPLTDLRRQTRQVVVHTARVYLEQAGEPVPSFDDRSLLLAGHQPELFHPGVWIKNFALHGLARLHRATPVNLVVDNDTAKSTALSLPPGEKNSGPADAFVRPLAVPFDQWAGEVPYEERRVRDEELFASLPERVRRITSAWPFKPMLPDFWAEVLRQAERTPLLGERFAAARRTLERRWGCHNLEVPVSALCRTEPFAWFVCHVLADLARFHEVYNACVRAYRRRHGLRSRNHPVPDLTAEDGWLEVPLWAWHPGQPRRGRLLARPGSDGIQLRVGQEAGPKLPPISLTHPEPAVRAWLELEGRGFKVRSRALTNTLFARLFAADLFLHGIGGGKYDELTDEIARRFYGAELPGFLVLSGTLLLPFPALPARPDQCLRLARHLRDLHCNPQRHLLNGDLADPTARALAERKRDWIAHQPRDAAGRRERYQELKRLTRQLHPYLTDQERQLHQTLDGCRQTVRVNALLQRRDYAFCLFPKAQLREFCTPLLS